MKTLYKNDLVEVSWYDEFDSKEHVEISILSEYDDGSGETYIRVENMGGSLGLTVQGWEGLINWLNYLIKNKEKFIQEYNSTNIP